MNMYRERLRDIISRLVETPVSSQTPDQHSRGRLLAALLLILSGLIVLSLVVITIVNPSSLLNPQSDFYDTLLALATLVVVYSINRAGKYRLAAWLLVILAAAIAVIMGMPYDNALLPDMLYYLVIPVLFASLLFDIRTAFLIALGMLLTIILLPLFYPSLNLFDLLYGQGVFILTVSSVIWLTGYYRNRLEADRQEQLRASESRLREYADQLESRVTERTAQLQRAKERAETVLFHSSDAVILTHPDGTIQQTNPAFDALFGYEDDALFRKPLDVLVDKAFMPALHHSIQQVAAGQGASRFELLARRHDGTTFSADALLTGIAELEEGGRMMVCSLRDISTLKQKEMSLRAALEREREMNEMKTRLVTAVSHEFRTPLAIIYSSADLLRLYGERLSEARKQEHVVSIQTQVDHITTMLDNIITAGRDGSESLGLDSLGSDK